MKFENDEKKVQKKFRDKSHKIMKRNGDNSCKIMKKKKVMRIKTKLWEKSLNIMRQNVWNYEEKSKTKNKYNRIKS